VTRCGGSTGTASTTWSSSSHLRPASRSTDECGSCPSNSFDHCVRKEAAIKTNLPDGNVITTSINVGEYSDSHEIEVETYINGERRPLADLTDDEVEAMVHRAVVRAYNQETK
jgi:hypothetical protein